MEVKARSHQPVDSSSALHNGRKIVPVSFPSAQPWDRAAGGGITFRHQYYRSVALRGRPWSVVAPVATFVCSSGHSHRRRRRDMKAFGVNGPRRGNET